MLLTLHNQSQECANVTGTPQPSPELCACDWRFTTKPRTVRMLVALHNQAQDCANASGASQPSPELCECYWRFTAKSRTQHSLLADHNHITNQLHVEETGEAQTLGCDVIIIIISACSFRFATSVAVSFCYKQTKLNAKDLKRLAANHTTQAYSKRALNKPM